MSHSMGNITLSLCSPPSMLHPPTMESSSTHCISHSKISYHIDKYTSHIQNTEVGGSLPSTKATSVMIETLPSEMLSAI